MLTDAWKLYASYDYNAGRQQRNFRRYQGALLLLGLGATLLATLMAWRQTPPTNALWKMTFVPDAVFTAAIVLVTATTSGLLSALSHFKPGEKWLALRAGAQATQREIYGYLMQAGEYRGHAEPSLLYHRLNAISAGLGDAILQAPPPASAAQAGTEESLENTNAEAFPMTPDRYVSLRLTDQAAYYHRRVQKLNRHAQWLHGISIAAGTAGTVLALLKQPLWIPLTAAVTTAAVSYLQQRQIEVTLAQYNQSGNSLARVDRWWRNELSEAERALPDNRDKLVSFTEDILSAELTSWTQKLSEAMAKMAAPPTPDITATPTAANLATQSQEVEAVVSSKVYAS